MTSNGNLNWANERRRLAELEPWPRNPRQIREKQAETLVASVAEFGQVETLAIGPDNQVYNGHQRLNVLMAKHGPDYEVDVRVSSRPLSEKEREKLTVYLHKGAAGEWNFDILANEFDVDELLDWGFEDWELGIEAEQPDAGDAEPQVNRAEELREQWGVESGQLWRLPSRVAGQEHRLVCGDCTDASVVVRVMGGERADMVTDPPYGMSLDTDWSDAIGSMGSIGAKNKTRGNVYAPVIGDGEPYNPAPLFELYDFEEMFLFGADYYCERIPGKNAGSWLVWDKRKESQAEAIGSEFELIWSKQG